MGPKTRGAAKKGAGTKPPAKKNEAAEDNDGVVKKAAPKKAPAKKATTKKETAKKPAAKKETVKKPAAKPKKTVKKDEKEKQQEAPNEEAKKPEEEKKPEEGAKESEKKEDKPVKQEQEDKKVKEEQAPKAKVKSEKKKVKKEDGGDGQGQPIANPPFTGSRHAINGLLPYLALGFVPEETDGTANQCGLHALVQSLRAARDLTNNNIQDHVTFEQAQAILRSNEYRERMNQRQQPGLAGLPRGQANAILRANRVRSFYNSEMLDLLLVMLNEQVNTRFRLGVITAGGTMDGANGMPVAVAPSVQLFGLDNDDPILWIWNNNADRLNHGQVAHWESLGPSITREGVLERNSWGLGDQIHAAHEAGVHLAQRDVPADDNSNRIELVQNQFYYQVPSDDGDGADANTILVTARKDLDDLRNITVNDSDQGTANLADLQQVDLDAFDEVWVDPLVTEDADDDGNARTVPINMYRLHYTEEKDEKKKRRRAEERFFEEGEALLLVEAENKLLLRNRLGNEAWVSRNHLQRITAPFHIDRIIRPRELAPETEYPGKIIDLESMLTERGLTTDDAAKLVKERNVQLKSKKGKKEPLQWALRLYDDDQIPNSIPLLLHRLNDAARAQLDVAQSGIAALADRDLALVEDPDKDTSVLHTVDGRQMQLNQSQRSQESSGNWGIRLPTDEPWRVQPDNIKDDKKKKRKKGDDDGDEAKKTKRVKTEDGGDQNKVNEIPQKEEKKDGDGDEDEDGDGKADDGKGKQGKRHRDDGDDGDDGDARPTKKGGKEA